MSTLERFAGGDLRRMILALLALAGVACLLGGPVAPTAAAAAPIDNEEPEVEVVGTLRVGGTLVCYPGSWEGSVGQFVYTWLRGGVPIAGATKIKGGTHGSEYKIKSADEGWPLSCEVEPEGSGVREESFNYVEVPGKAKPEHAPELLPEGNPTVSCTSCVRGAAPTEKSKLRCSQGEWSANPGPTFGYQWLRGGVAIEKATSNEYEVVAADAGHWLSCRVTATNSKGSNSANSSNELKVTGTRPTMVEEPRVLGVLTVGQTVTCSPGEWSGAPAPSFAYLWFRGSTQIGQTNTYTLKEEDAGKSIFCEVTAKNSEGEAKAKSKAVVVSGSAPSNTSPPEIEGEGHVGSTLTCLHGKWNGAPTPTYEYQWLRDGAAIATATTSTYKVQTVDETHTLSCQVTAHNGSGSASATSSGLPIAGTPPKNTKAPEVSGTPAVGKILSCSAGTWSGAPVPTFTYQWLRGPAKIPFATAATYTVQEEDETSTLACEVTAKNAEGEATAVSTGVVIPGTAPENTKAPVISGKAQVTSALTCSQGTWKGKPTPTYSYQWLREGSPIGGATEAFYTVAAVDEGHTLACEVTASNSQGHRSQTSEGVVIPKAGGGKAPANTLAPAITGKGSFGETLTCSKGSWTEEPTGYAYAWLRNGSAIAGAGAGTYKVAIADEGYVLTCKVTATNAYGGASAFSSEVKIAGEAPEDITPPKIIGNPVIGETLTCNAGEWSGEPTPTLKYEWLRNGESVPGLSYVVAEADAGQSLACQVTATNSEGKASAASKAVVIAGTPPKLVSAPHVSGVPKVGETLSCSPGEWSGAPKPTLSVVWLFNGAEIAGAKEETHVVAAEEAGGTIACRVYAVNKEGSESDDSNTLTIAASKLESSQPPQITGAPELGETLSCSTGTWSGEPQPTSFSFQWLREGHPIAGGNSTVYVVSEADRGTSLGCEVTAENSEEDVSARSSAVAIPGVAPVNVKVPQISGPEKPGLDEVLTCLPGTWTGTPPPTLRYEWLREGLAIEGATASTYTIEKLDVGRSLSCRVVAENSSGEEHATSRRVHVPGLKPENTEAPKVEGQVAVGENVTCDRGAWNAKPAADYKYQWLLGGRAIPSATASTYALEPEDLGQAISCRIVAVNNEGSAVANSSNSPVVAAKAVHQFEKIVEPPITHQTHTTTLTDAQLLAALERQLASVERAHIRSLLKSGAVKFTFLAPAAGTLALSWLQVATGAHGAGKHKPVLIARVSVAYTSASTKTLTLKLTRAGKHLIRSGKRIRLTAQSVFTLPGRTPVTWQTTFTLSR